ncbi:aminotransferase class I/II-fold pyridoxal phosphate-dependent enzyme [Herbiconiux solani]|uniref:aminotransferase class I/II-fold pyridoxal phosphate-dependent enzyme n=1 Tax=Herbiconiux solani TaxID=661329 RepID=UPI000AE5DC84|nr:aminotransferase class I/II-fold pyridoxal phosphate-dependent enzyme [Herbiconiux solani]
MPRLASHTDSVPPSGIRRSFELAHSVEDVIYLVVGEPDVSVDAAVLTRGAAAWEADDTDYTPNGGIPELREAIVRSVAERNGIPTETERVWITNGATQALYLAMSLLLDPGDEVLVPDPGYTTFTMNAHLLAATPVPYPLRPENAFEPDLAELERLITDRTRVLIVNSPSNPLGAVFGEATLRALLAFAVEHDLWILSDEVYERFSYGTPHLSIAGLDPAAADRVLTVFSASKTYALTGARVGWLLTPPGFAPLMRSAQEAMISCVNTPAQRAVVTALEGSQEHVTEAADHYRSNLAHATALLRERGIRYLEPTGAFYLWVDVSHASGGDVAEWAERFLLEERVAVAPGSAFGRMGEGWIRLCVAAGLDDLLEGIRRLPAPADATAAPAGQASSPADPATDAVAPRAAAPTRPAEITIRLIRPDEYDAVSRQRYGAYAHDFDIEGPYGEQVAAVAEHATTAEVWVAVDEPSGHLLGSVTLPRDGGALTTLAHEGELEFRLLAVDPAARGRGVGRLLTEFVLAEARRRGAHRVVMNSGTEMIVAHRLYESLGFTRMPDRENPPGIEPTRAYGLDLTDEPEQQHAAATADSEPRPTPTPRP